MQPSPPLSELGRRRRNNWPIFPPEILLTIFAYYLCFNAPVSRSVYKSQYERDLVEFMRTASLRALVVEAFYTGNRICLHRLPIAWADCQFWMGRWTYPPRCNNRFITKLALTVKWEERRSRTRTFPMVSTVEGDWKFLARLARGEFGFEGLRDVDLLIRAQTHLCTSECIKMSKEIEREGITFNVEKFEVKDDESFPRWSGCSRCQVLDEETGMLVQDTDRVRRTLMAAMWCN